MVRKYGKFSKQLEWNVSIFSRLFSLDHLILVQSNSLKFGRIEVLSGNGKIKLNYFTERISITELLRRSTQYSIYWCNIYNNNVYLRIVFTLASLWFIYRQEWDFFWVKSSCVLMYEISQCTPHRFRITNTQTRTYTFNLIFGAVFTQIY